MSSHTAAAPALHGVVARYADGEALLAAAAGVREAGYTRVDAFSPRPVHGLADLLGADDRRVPWLIFAAGMAGAVGGFLLQVYVAAIDYPMNVGGRPMVSWPSFIPVTFECAILAAAFAAVLGMLGMNGLPRPHHPVFAAPGFDRASSDAYFLCVEASDPRFDAAAVAALLQRTGATQVTEVHE